MTNNCADCGKEIGRKAKTGRCRRCFTVRMNADPEFQARRKERIRQKMADPAHRAKMAAIIRRNSARWQASPEGRAWMEANGRRLANEVLQRPEVMAKATSPESIEKRVRTRRTSSYGWFPPERTEQYVFLTKKKKLPAKEAVKVIRDEIAAERAALSPFERQMRALQNGARLVANDARPSHLQPTFSDPTLRRAG